MDNISQQTSSTAQLKGNMPDEKENGEEAKNEQKEPELNFLPRDRFDREALTRVPAKDPEISIRSKSKIDAPDEINEIEQKPPEEVITPEDKAAAISQNPILKAQSSISKTAREKNFESILEVGLSPALEEKIQNTHKKEKKIIEKTAAKNKKKDYVHAERPPVKISSKIRKAEKLKKTVTTAPNLLIPKGKIRPEVNNSPPPLNQ